ncbi:MAG: sigma-70 family RNA polymerase sigma factor [Polyangiales bacterium]
MAGEELIVQHRKMVVGLASRLRRELSLSGDLDDLVAFGFGGLLEAQHRFDPSRGVRFQTFAYHRVRGAMLDGVRQMADLPRRAHERLREETACQPTAAPTPLDKAFTRISARLTSPSPVQGSYAEENPEAALLKNESIERLLGALSRLSMRQRVLLRGRYFEGRPLDAMAAELGVSKSWASRLHTQALEALRAALKAP